MGRNGVGKTTLLNCIMGSLPVTSGEITYLDMALHTLPMEQRAKHGIGYVPQGRQIFSRKTCKSACLPVRTGPGRYRDSSMNCFRY